MKILTEAQKEMVGDSIVRKNLLTEEYYTGYCGKDMCSYRWPRTIFNGHQFVCKCGWVSAFPEEFINEYKKQWGL